MNTTSVAVTAGLGGFLVLFGLALAVWVLGRDLNKRLRRMRVTEQQRQLAEREAADRPAADRKPAERDDGDSAQDADLIG